MERKRFREVSCVAVETTQLTEINNKIFAIFSEQLIRQSERTSGQQAGKKKP